MRILKVGDTVRLTHKFDITNPLTDNEHWLVHDKIAYDVDYTIIEMLDYGAGLFYLRLVAGGYWQYATSFKWVNPMTVGFIIDMDDC